jgi:hypothetical protein
MIVYDPRLAMSHAAHQLKDELLITIPFPSDMALIVLRLDSSEFFVKNLTFGR